MVVAVRWYVRYKLSYRDAEELLAERCIPVASRVCLGRGQLRRRGRHHQPPFTPDVAEPSVNPVRVSAIGSLLEAMEELFVDVLAAGLAYVLELLVVGLIRQVLRSSNC
jgi:hypothetical protein